jgi:hypothetical protein
MDYAIAIPTYNRSDQLPTKTLATLREGNIPMENIYIFVVAEELELYRASCPGYNVVVGELGLVQQREFIHRYFPAYSYIVFLDDDLQQIYRPTSEKTKEVITDLHPVLMSMIDRMKEEHVSICGTYPVDNIMFSYKSEPVTTKLRYLVGAFYIIKNLRDTDLILEPVECTALEDKYRTLYYYLKEGMTLRFNHICFKTKYFGRGGMFSDDREKLHGDASVALVLKYPGLTRLKFKKNGLVDVAFKHT